MKINVSKEWCAAKAALEAGQSIEAGLPPAVGSAGVHPRYDEAILPEPGEQIHAGSTCADCGHSSHDFGRFRKAEPYEQADEDGEIYECGYCGGVMIVPPPICKHCDGSGWSDAPTPTPCPHCVDGRAHQPNTRTETRNDE